MAKEKKLDNRSIFIAYWAIVLFIVLAIWIYSYKNNSPEDEINKILDDIESQIPSDNNYSEVDNNLESNIENNMTKKDNFQTMWPQDGDLVAVMKTSNWTIKIRLFKDDVPTVVNNFIGLASKGYYKDLIFHRVIKDFMIQWWDPEWTGRWWESIYWNKFDDEFSSKLSNIRWSISMANAWPNTNGSQFFINHNDNVNLDFDKQPLTSKHAVFWQVYEWMENVDKIAKTKTWPQDKPEKDVKIISVEIKEYNKWSLKDYKVDIDELVEYYENKKLEKKSKKVESWDSISVHYTGKLEDWTIFDSSVDRDPIEFTVWAGQMIKWFDAWVVGMKIGDKKTLTLLPNEAYWEYSEDNIQEVPRAELKSFEDAWIELVSWAELQTMMWIFKIKDVKGDTIIVDMNHMLAWKTLIFDIELVDIK